MDDRPVKTGPQPNAGTGPEVVKTDAEWRAQLTPQQYVVCRQAGTEAPFSGALYLHKEAGTYACVCCDNALFASGAKYDSGSGWPSFYEPAGPEAVTEHEDASHGMVRTEVRCGRCDAHLGHVFPDGPQPTGLRYCINAVCLDFIIK